jgi:hypothetical protein
VSLAAFSFTYTTDRYCNARYAFCVEYPASLLPEKQLLADFGGIRLKTSDLSCEVEVLVVPRAPEQTPKDIFDTWVKGLASPEKPPTVLNYLFAYDFYESYFTFRERNYFHRSYSLEGYFVRLVISVPANRPFLMQRLREDVKMVFAAERK